MDLDLTAIVAQVINFAVLVWLLNRFLYKPVTGIMEARAQRLRQDMERAEELAARAREAEAAYRERLEALERERELILQEAREIAREERDRLLAEAAEEARAARRRFAESWETERRELLRAVEARLIENACETSGRILAQLTGVSLADALIATLESRLGSREAAAGEDVAVDGKVVVRTSFEPAPAQRERLAALALRLAAPAAAGGPAGVDVGHAPGGNAGGQGLEFVVAPDLVLGVEIETGGTVIAWTAREMLDELRRDALAALDMAVHGEAAAAGGAFGEPGGAGGNA